MSKGTKRYQLPTAWDLCFAKDSKKLLNGLLDDSIKFADDLDNKREQIVESLDIDKYALDEEFIRQPNLFMSIGNVQAHARYWVDYFTNLVRAIPYLLVVDSRNRAETAGSKFTEARLTSEAETHPHLALLRGELARWRQMNAILETAREAAIQRSTALSKLASMWEKDYWAADAAKSSKEE